jgi:hypothetical protein
LEEGLKSRLHKRAKPESKKMDGNGKMEGNGKKERKKERARQTHLVLTLF